MDPSTDAHIRRAVLGACVVGLGLGCKMPNPAFDQDSFAGASETNTAVTDSDPNPDTGGADTGSSTQTDTDSVGTDSVGTETGESESSGSSEEETGGEELCPFEVRPRLRLAVGPPQLEGCSGEITGITVGLTTFNAELGIASGTTCNADCTLCVGPEASLGAPGFPVMIDLWTELANEVELMESGVICVDVATRESAEPLEPIDDLCFYGSLEIVRIESGLLFAGQVGEGERVDSINALLPGEDVKSSSEPIETCTCEGLFDPESMSFDCCEAGGGDPSFYSLTLFGQTVDPGYVGPVPGIMPGWDFHAVQAQTVPRCENEDGSLELAWALTPA